MYAKSFRDLKKNLTKAVALCAMELAADCAAALFGVLFWKSFGPLWGVLAAAAAFIFLACPLHSGAGRLYWLRDSRGRFWEFSQLFFYFSSLRCYRRLLGHFLHHAACLLGLFLLCAAPGASLFSGLLRLGQGAFGLAYELMSLFAVLLSAAGLVLFVWIRCKLSLVPYLFYERPGHSYLQLVGVSADKMKGRTAQCLQLLCLALLGAVWCLPVFPILLIQPHLRLLYANAAREWMTSGKKQKEQTGASEEKNHA